MAAGWYLGGGLCLVSQIIIGLTSVAVRAKGKEVVDTLRSLGAERRLILWTIMKESRYSILGGIIAGFGRVVAEVGAGDGGSRRNRANFYSAALRANRRLCARKNDLLKESLRHSGVTPLTKRRFFCWLN